MVHDWFARLRSLFRRRQAEQDLQDEVQDHLERETAKYMQAGVPTEEAERRARIALGGPEQIRQQCRDARGTRFVENLMQDLRYSSRSLTNAPGFAIVIILTLALGIGSCTAIFSLMTAVLFPPLPYGEVGHLLYVTTPNRHLPEVPPDALIPDNADFNDLMQQNHSFSQMTQFEQFKGNLALQQTQVPVGGARVDGNFFSTLEVSPEQGRAIDAQDDDAGRDGVALISHSLWQQMFAGNRDTLGKPLTLDGKRYRIIGIMPPGFHYPSKNDIDYGDAHISPADVWIPLALTTQQKQTRGLSDGEYALARLRPGVSRKQADADLNTIMKRLNPLHDPSTFVDGWYASLKPFRETIEGSARPLLLLLMGAVLFVLLIACGNAANLLLARSASRSHELGVRATLGAGRGRLVLQMLTESVVLGICGGLAGVGLAFLFLKLLLLLDPGNIPRLHEASLNGRVLAFTVSVTLITSIASGILPALSASRVHLVAFLKSGGQRGAIGGRNRLRSSLIAVEVATVVVLLAGAGLLLRSYINIEAIPTGFEASTLSMKIDLRNGGITPEQAPAFLRSLLDQIRSVPGVMAAGAVNDLPFGENQGVGYFWVQGYPNQQGQMVDGASITPGYFSAMGMPLLEGRSFTESDGKPHAGTVIINQAFAKKYFPGRDPIGKWLWSDQPVNGSMAGKPALTVVGVVADVRDLKLEEPATPQLFNCLDNPDNAYLVIRSLLPPSDVTASAQAIVHRINPRVQLIQAHTMRELVSEATARRRFQTMLLTAFSSMAFVLALVGLYGLTAYAVRQRRPEMGVRIALGGSRAHVMLLVLRQGLLVVTAGLFVGLALTLALTRLLAASLYGVTAFDPVTFVAVPGVLLLTAAAACLIPARRAALVDPMTTLRYE